MEYSQAILDEKKIIERSCKLHWFHWLVVASSLIITLTAWYVSSQSVEYRVAQQFEREAKQAVELVEERMELYESALWSGVATIDMLNNDLTSTQWANYAKSLRIGQKYPGINGIGVIYYVPPDQKETFITHHRTMSDSFRIHPQHNRDEYWPITFIEPLSTNAAALGLDMAHEDNRYTGVIRARDTGRAQITAPITLVQDSASTPGFLFYAPFYAGGENNTLEEKKENVLGVVYAPFIFKKLIAGTLDQDRRRIGLEIRDKDSILYSEHNDGYGDYDKNPLYQQSYEIDLYGRTWVFDIRSTHSFRSESNSSQPLVILIGGILIDALLLTMFIIIANTNQRSLQLVQRVMDGKKSV